MTPAPVSLLGVTAWPRALEELLAEVSARINSGVKTVIPHHNLHSAALAKKDPKFKEFFELHPGAHIDGMALVFWGRLLGLPLQAKHRVTYLDLIGPLMDLAAASSWRVFHLGGQPGVGERAADKLQEEHGVRVAVHHGFFANQEIPQVVQRIGSHEPHLVLVGMGMPVQEHWLLDNLASLPDAVYMCSGGCFDYLAGVQKAPPRWSGRAGLEWLFRLAHQPRRLARRYIAEPLILLPEMRRDVAAAWRRRSKQDEGA